ncbi:hypothetical protein L544_1098 [Bordetella hinzii OH87 BAL007II]|uniref:Uncharacterized protein n=1 Tax=Bordetella hinzii OH87 BAL007II TaxID=1331262 RepID=A0ABR4R386_9BORD|nr:hypothetical protein L544_1098 [Bordetella hinzii OH87 BAL007II]KCB28379.1 hypothetical protein L543_1402 [Bordetella hinzii L60]
MQPTADTADETVVCLLDLAHARPGVGSIDWEGNGPPHLGRRASDRRRCRIRPRRPRRRYSRARSPRARVNTRPYRRLSHSSDGLCARRRHRDLGTLVGGLIPLEAGLVHLVPQKRHQLAYYAHGSLAFLSACA